MATSPLIINGFDAGIADSPHKGIGWLRNVQLGEFPGAMRCSNDIQPNFAPTFNQTFTADPATDICSAAGSLVPSLGSFVGFAVTFTTTVTLPAPLATGTVYFLIYVSGTTFKVATTRANANSGTAIDITTTGTGTHTVNFVTPGTINWLVKDPRTSYIYAQDSNARVWVIPSGQYFYLVTGNTLTQAAGNGLNLFRSSNGNNTWLFAFRNAAIDVVDVFGNTQIENPSWTNSWQSMNSGAGSGNNHHCITAQDNIQYFTDDKYVGSIKENAGQSFDPSNAATYTYNNQALDMPQGEVNYWLEELGVSLLVAGNSYNKVYPWDRVSDSYNLPLPMPENNVYRMKNIGNIVYIQAGLKGNIYQTQGTYVRHFKKLPEAVTNNTNSLASNLISWGGMGAKPDGTLIIGISSTFSSAVNGVYLIYPDGRLSHDNRPGTVTAKPQSILADTDFYYMGYQSSCDQVASNNRYSSYALGAIMQSQLYRVATKTEKAAYSKLEVVIANPEGNGGVQISYRTDHKSSFTTIDTFSANNTITFQNDAIGLIDLEQIQVQAEFFGNYEIVEIRLLP